MTEQTNNVVTMPSKQPDPTSALLINVSVSIWTARKHDKAVSREVAANHGAADAEHTGRYNKILMMSDALERLEKNRREMRQFLYSATLAWDDNGNRVISDAGFFDLMAEIKKYQTEHERLVSLFLPAYPALVDEQRKRLNGLFKEADYPKPNEIERRFNFDWAIRKIEDASDFRSQLGQQFENEVRAEIEQRVNNQWQAAQDELITRLKETIAHISTRLTDYGRAKKNNARTQLHASVIDNVTSIIDCLPGLNIAGDAELARLCDDIKSKLATVDVDSLKESEPAREQVIATADAALAQITELYK